MRWTIAVLAALSCGVAQAESYPTTETVTMVVNCMVELGGQSEENLYTCACRHDVIRAALTFHEYESGSLYERYKSMPGEKGAVFRDSRDGAAFAKKLGEARKSAAASCPTVKHIEPVARKAGSEQ